MEALYPDLSKLKHFFTDVVNRVEGTIQEMLADSDLLGDLEQHAFSTSTTTTEPMALYMVTLPIPYRPIMEVSE